MHSETYELTDKELTDKANKDKVTDKICFSSDCWWIKAKIRCKNCPYVDAVSGKVLDIRVGGNVRGWFCGGCGAKIGENDKVCSRCGKRFQL